MGPSIKPPIERSITGVRRTCIAIVLSAVVGTALAAQDRPARFQSGVDLISVTATVVDREGRLVTGLPIEAFETSYFLSRETVVPAPRRAMVRWRQNLFEAMSRNAGRAVDFFGIPHNAVIELGTRVQL